MNDLFLARILHMLAVVVWLGGVFMATAVILPAIRKNLFGSDKLASLHVVEYRFSWIARIAILIVGASGFYMTWKMQLWARFHNWHFWWMDAMVGVWAIFIFLLFIGEPVVLRRFFPRLVAANEDRAFAVLHWVHVTVLALALITVAGAVAGAHGWNG
ncbi:MAG: hypothetical protein ACK5ME_00915 [Parahaliea sp.]